MTDDLKKDLYIKLLDEAWAQAEFFFKEVSAAKVAIKDSKTVEQFIDDQTAAMDPTDKRDRATFVADCKRAWDKARDEINQDKAKIEKDAFDKEVADLAFQAL